MDRLPNELVLAITDLLDVDAAVKLRGVSRRWRDVVDHVARRHSRGCTSPLCPTPFDALVPLRSECRRHALEHAVARQRILWAVQVVEDDASCGINPVFEILFLYHQLRLYSGDVFARVYQETLRHDLFPRLRRESIFGLAFEWNDLAYATAHGRLPDADVYGRPWSWFKTEFVPARISALKARK